MGAFEQSPSSEATLSSSDSLLVPYEKNYLCRKTEVQFVSKKSVTAREYRICQRVLHLTKINLLFSK